MVAIPLMNGRFASLGANGAGNFGGGGGRKEFFNQKKAEIERGAGTARSEKVTVGDGALVGENGGKLSRDGEMSGVAASVEQTGVVQNGGRGADRGEPPSGGVLGEDEWADAGIGAEEFHAGAAGKKEAVKFTGEGRTSRGTGGERREGRIGSDSEATATGYEPVGVEGGGCYGRAGTTEEVDGRGELNLFKAFRKDCENGGHGVS